jgi:crotonobetaine/carnitine-CoA ligase
VGDDYRAGSCGRESPYYDVQVVDANDNPVAAGVSGEIVVRPKKPFLICSGYVNMPDSTVKAWRNLWLHCGDRGRRDSDGWFYFEDRMTDSIRRRGENISSYEVEQLVAKHPAVAEVAALAAPSAVGEDEVWILVILRQDHQASYEDILLHCEATMPYFMIPLYIDIVDALPRTPTAKVEKYKQRKTGPGPATWNRQANGWELTRNGLKAPTAQQRRPHAGS